VKTYLRILQYVRKYPGYIAGFAVSVVLMAGSQKKNAKNLRLT